MALDFGVYSNKVCTADKAVTTVPSGSHVFVGTACATPRLLLGALEALSTPPRDVTILSFLTDAALPLSEGKTITNYKHKCFFVGTEMRNAIQQGVADYIPISLAELPRHIKNGNRSPRVNYDYLLACVRKRDELFHRAWKTHSPSEIVIVH